MQRRDQDPAKSNPSYGLPKTATSAGVLAEMTWPEPAYQTQIRMVRQYFRIMKMDRSRLTRRIHVWDEQFSKCQNVQTWSSEVQNILTNHNQEHCYDPQVKFCDQSVIAKLKKSMSVFQSVDL